MYGEKWFCLSTNRVCHYLHIPNTSNKILERHLQVWVKDPSGAFSDCVWKGNAIKLEFLVTEDPGLRWPSSKRSCR